MPEKRDYKEERREHVNNIINRTKEKEKTDADTIKGIFSLCFLCELQIVVIIGIWGFIKFINWVVDK